GTWCDETKKYSGKNIAEICAVENKTPGEVVCEILEKDECLTGAFFHGMSEENLTKIFSCDWVLAGSDASLRAPWGPLGKDHPHPRAYGTMIEFFHRVKAISSRENAVKRMTYDAAKRFEIPKRGVLEKGYYADIVIFDENEFSSLSTYANPHKFAMGVKYVFVNGVLSYKEGDFKINHSLANRAGRFLERN
ncbi:MAG: amidohydrolase family protein, partial [Kiritimatiellae bacterium]|nr:amidohydrolase family protein [Kiritimatiellia bacterium]